MSKRPIAIEDLLRIRGVSDPQISPDGERVVFTVKTIDSEKNRYRTHLWMADLSSGEARQFTHGDGRDSSPRWSPDGRTIAFLRSQEGHSQLWLIPAYGGEARQLTRMEEGGLSAPAWSPDGRRIAFAFRPTHADWTDEAARKRKDEGKSSPPRVVTRLRYRLEGAGFLDCRRHIWVCDAQTGEARQLTEGDYDHDSPAWSPDGTQIALVANRGDDPDFKPHELDIWLLPDGGGELRRVPAPTGPKGRISWSPDGRRIAYVGSDVQDDPWQPRNPRLWVADLESGEARCLTESLDRAVGNLTLGDTREYSEGGISPVWSADGSQLLVMVSDRGSCHIYAVPSAGGQPVRLTQGETNIMGVTADAERRRLAIVADTATALADVFTADWNAAQEGSLALRPVTSLNREFVDEVSVSQPEEVWFQSPDGTEVQGWVLRPPDFDASRRYPLLLYIHGGPHDQYGYTFFHEFQSLASRGYVLFYCNPRGSMGREEAFASAIRGNWGSVDYEDLMAAADCAASLPYVDSERTAVAGGSYGGFMVNWIIGHTDRFACAVTERTVSNLHADFGTVDAPEVVDGYWEGDAWDRPETLWRQSPLRYASNMRTPLLIIHSEGDLRCPIHHAEQLFAALKHLRREVVFVRYPVETNHGMSRSGPPDLRMDRLNRIAEWLDQHLKTDAALSQS